MNKQITMFVALLAVTSLCYTTFAITEVEFCKNWYCNPKTFNFCSTNGTCTQWLWQDLSGNNLLDGDEDCESIAPNPWKDYSCQADLPPTIAAIRTTFVCDCEGNSCDGNWSNEGSEQVNVSRKIGNYCPWSPYYTLCMGGQLLLDASTWPDKSVLLLAYRRGSTHSCEYPANSLERSWWGIANWSISAKELRNEKLQWSGVLTQFFGKLASERVT
ncbi:MAG: hypothetical protein ACLQU3_28320 [Limisphaerales bacterium]